MEIPAQKSPLARFRLPAAGVIGPAALILGAWLFLTPSGMLGKADAVGYAVCHRIDLRSFHMGVRALPLCARCSGMYLGAVGAIAGLLAMGRRRHGGFPRLGLLVVQGAFAAAWAIDGLNSYLTLIPGAPHAYQPSNLLRLITGTLMGISLGTLVFAGFAQNAWRDWSPEPALRSPRDLGVLLLAAGAAAGLVLTNNPLILYPLALISAAGVVLVLTGVYTVVVLLISRRENRAQGWSDLALPVLGGLTLAMVQIGVLDLLRFSLTHTWAGFSL